MSDRVFGWDTSLIRGVTTMWCWWTDMLAHHENILIITHQKAAPPRPVCKHTWPTTTHRVKITPQTVCTVTRAPNTSRAKGNQKTHTHKPRHMEGNTHCQRGSRSPMWWQGWITGTHLDVANPSAILHYSTVLMGKHGQWKLKGLHLDVMCWGGRTACEVGAIAGD